MFQPFPFHFEGGGGSEYSGKIGCVFPESGGGRVRRGGKKSYQNSGKNSLVRTHFEAIVRDLFPKILIGFRICAENVDWVQHRTIVHRPGSDTPLS